MDIGSFDGEKDILHNGIKLMEIHIIFVWQGVISFGTIPIVKTAFSN